MPAAGKDKPRHVIRLSSPLALMAQWCGSHLPLLKPRIPPRLWQGWWVKQANQLKGFFFFFFFETASKVSGLLTPWRDHDFPASTLQLSLKARKSFFIHLLSTHTKTSSGNNCLRINTVYSEQILYSVFNFYKVILSQWNLDPSFYPDKN